jgi:DNA-binding XRE family transcriptional regulator
MEAVKREIKREISEMGLTQEEAGRLLGYSEGSLRKILYKESPGAMEKIRRSLLNYKEKEALKKALEKTLEDMGMKGLQKGLDSTERWIENMDGAELVENLRRLTGMSKPTISREIGMSETALYHGNYGKPTLKALQYLYLKEFYGKLLKAFKE